MIGHTTHAELRATRSTTKQKKRPPHNKRWRSASQSQSIKNLHKATHGQGAAAPSTAITVGSKPRSPLPLPHSLNQQSRTRGARLVHTNSIRDRNPLAHAGSRQPQPVLVLRRTTTGYWTRSGGKHRSYPENRNLKCLGVCGI